MKTAEEYKFPARFIGRSLGYRESFTGVAEERGERGGRQRARGVGGGRNVERIV